MQNKANLFVILTQEILSDKKLTATDKLILARFSGFNVIFESSESTAEFLGISATYVRDSKRKLEKMGYLVCVRNTGRGKAYRLNLNSVFYGLDSANIDEQTSKIYQSESGNSSIRLSKFLSQSQEIPA